MPFDRYFDQRSGRFSAHYGNELLTRALGRGPLFDRLSFAVDKAVASGAQHVLDVGCGSGPLFGPLASRGIRVTGVDPAPGMLARARAEAERFPGLVVVEQRGWESIDEVDRYDLAVALGVFDYVDQPGELLSRLGQAAAGVVGSFPAPGLRTDLRKIRYRRGGVDVHGYSRQRIGQLAQGAGLTVAELHLLGRAGYAVHFVR